MNAYSLRDLTHSYGRHPTLDVGSLDIRRGAVTGLVGPNGSGKSTLLKVLAFLEPHASGELLFEEKQTAGRESALRREVTLLLQESWLLRRTVYDNIAYGLKLRGLSAGAMDERVRDALERVGLHDRFASRPWFRLSGGEAQRVALAARLALRPRVLLLDEPTASVDEASAALIREAVENEARDHGTTIVVATHDLSWLHGVATQVVSLHRGRVIGDGAENLLQGAWRANGDHRELRAGGQVLRAPKGPDEPDCAVLSPSDVAIAREPASPTEALNALSGVLTRMSFERAGGDILGLVDCDGLALRVRFSQERAQELNLVPGLVVHLSFPPDAVRFL